ncbi:hypothetical protein LOTGIDRAFT_232257 [Lottia gigantea]|uniref:Translin-associated factor X-interacting protein 1 N-terminal domain-containing protein n=1 Tax=Lottia gigantea TaxID=225164 RepID=V4AD75_LOTGI|nr:hypothetical protein LOTGIDRAFT_232257 [Lottia gigantea]ESO94807.1 hypothetical protein LOTGIDRAFT_232257 [Lottia gigantea]
MDYKFVASRQLKCLLNDAETKQKQDIHAYTMGHLNSSKLRQPPKLLSEQRGWKTGPPSSSLLTLKHSDKTYVTKVPVRQKEMKDVLYQFSTGTTGTLPSYKCENDVKKLLFLQESLSNAEVPEPKSKYIPDGVLIEELDAQEICMHSPKSLTETSDDTTDMEMNFKTFPKTETAINNPLRHSFIPGQSSGITKQDQYRTYRQFESSIIRKREAQETKVLSGNQAVFHHENHLRQGLSTLKGHVSGPNFHKLQVHSNVFDDITEESPTFKFILQDIKSAYDDYISKLLDTQTAKHQLLHDQVEQMAANAKTQPEELEFVKNKVEDYEIEAKWLLEENQRLREAVREETDLLALTPEIEPIPKVISVRNDEPPAELSEELQHTKALILEKMDALNKLHANLREDHVPLTVCTHLEQCIKETEIEVQKLLKQNEYFEKSINDMEHDLKEAITDADTSEKDARRIWRKVNSLRAQPGDDDEDEGKWNWYIS